MRYIPALLASLLALSVPAVHAQSASAPTSGSAAIRPAAAIVADIRRADYEGDRDALRRLHDELAPVPDDPKTAARILYWRSFALWRRAINGFNEPATDPGDLERDLENASREFEEAFRRDPQFHDANIGLISCQGLIAFLHRADQARLQKLGPRLRPIVAATRAAAEDNPRFIWVIGQSQWNALPGTPQKDAEERRARVLQSYVRGLELARKERQVIRDPLEPSWGEPELLMNLAWSNLNQTTPDVMAAERYARQALALVPYWHYVRDILLPQIERAKRAR